MSKDNLKNRSIWQDYSLDQANEAERNFMEVFSNYLKDSDFVIRYKPNEFNKIYLDIELSNQDKQEIYVPEEPITKHGIIPDYAIDNLKTSKSIYIEVKRQDGWVEGKKRSDGRGNAHERSCKFFTPSLLKILRERSRIEEDALPFWTIFQGDITRDPCRVREITCWYSNYVGHYFFWRNSKDDSALIAHFEKYIRPLLL